MDCTKLVNAHVYYHLVYLRVAYVKLNLTFHGTNNHLNSTDDSGAKVDAVEYI